MEWVWIDWVEGLSWMDGYQILEGEEGLGWWQGTLLYYMEG